jgi:alpha-L-rhamnosidase
MRRRLFPGIFPFLICIYFLPVQLAAQTAFKITDCQTEYLSNPLGLDVQSPRFTWKIAGTGAFHQKTFRVLVSTDSLALQQDAGDGWDSGWTESENNLVTYQGQALKSFTRYFWRVLVKDTNNLLASASASFETGMMQPADWTGNWISDGESIAQKSAPYFRRTFRTKGAIKSARAYIAVAGLYELYINGAKVDNHSLDPMYTRYDRRTLYLTHDVTRALVNGDNTLGVLLGNGWYNHQSTAVWYFDRAPWRDRPAFCMDLRITYADGSVETIRSGKDWKTTLGPLVFNSIYTAEHYDARRELPGWNTNAYQDTAWKAVTYRSAPSPNIVAQSLRPIRRKIMLPARSCRKVNDSTYVFDFGQNIAGVTALTVQGPRHTRIRLIHGERLTSEGHVDMSNIDVHYRPKDNSDPFQTDIFTLKGLGEEEFSPRFNYKGFQYVELVSNKPLSITRENLRAYFMHSDVPPVGTIRTSNDMLNKLWSATNNSYLSNLFGYPTDCPQREKNGWTGDAVIACETGLYNFDGITVYEKWIADHADEQQPNGVLPSIIPTSGWGYEWGNGPDWTSSIVMIPWNIYLFYGDKQLLEKYYANMTRYVDHITGQYPQGLTTWGLGDWVPVKSKAPVELTSTCYYYADVLVLAKTAALLKKDNDRRKYETLANTIKEAFNAKFLNRTTHVYGSGLQTELSVPLYWGLVPEEHKAAVAASLAKRLEQDGFQLDVGLLGQKAILSALSENGYAEIAYRLAARETYPSWGWWIKNGATTLYENWDIHAANDISLNHIMFGEIGAWLYKGLGGIYPDAEKPGFKHIKLRPNFVSGLSEFEATHTSPYGLIKSSWIRKNKKIYYTVVVPPNSYATVYLPKTQGQKIKLNDKTSVKTEEVLEGGTHVFVLD